MNALSYFIFAAGVLLEVVLIWRIQRGRLWRTYPFLCAYVYYVAARTSVLFGVLKLWPAAYAILYWLSDFIAVLLSLFILWEVFCRAFPAQLSLRGVVFKGLCVLVIGLALAYLLTSRTDANRVDPMSYPPLILRHAFAVAERDVSFVQAVLLLAILLGAWYYGRPLARNLWGVIVGLGMSVSVSTANYAAVALTRSFLPFWRIIGPASFVAMLGVWAWALWVYAPNPALTASTPEDPESYLSQWTEAWNRMLGTLRRILAP